MVQGGGGDTMNDLAANMEAGPSCFARKKHTRYELRVLSILNRAGARRPMIRVVIPSSHLTHKGNVAIVTHTEPPSDAFFIPCSKACSSVKPTLEISGIVQSVKGAPATRSKSDSVLPSGKAMSEPSAAVWVSCSACSLLRCAPAGDDAAAAKNGSSKTSWKPRGGKK